MAFKQLKPGIVLVFLLSAIVMAEARGFGVQTFPEGSKFILLAGRPFQIICNATISTTTKMYWTAPNRLTINEGNIKEERITEKLLKLTFTNPTYDDSGKYYCRCEYDAPMAYYGKQECEKLVEIQFYDPELKISSTFENVIAEEGSTLELNCFAIGDKPITYEWRNQFQQDMTSLSISTNGSVLKIPNLMSIVAGSYTCTASNNQGKARKEFEILIRSSLDKDKNSPFIRYVHIINVTANTVQFGISANVVASSIRVRYSVQYSSIVFVKEWKRGDVYEVNGLTAGYTYIFRFKAIPEDNGSEQTIDRDIPSEEYKVVMLPLKPDVVIHSHTAGSIRIGWNRKKEYKNVDKYKLVYFPIALDNDGNFGPSSCPITIDIPFCSNVNYTLSGLSFKRYYEFQLQAHTASGYGEPYKQKIYIQ